MQMPLPPWSEKYAKPVLCHALRRVTREMFSSAARIHPTTSRHVVLGIGTSGSCTINQFIYWSLTFALKDLL